MVHEAHYCGALLSDRALDSAVREVASDGKLHVVLRFSDVLYARRGTIVPPGLTGFLETTRLQIKLLCFE